LSEFLTEKSYTFAFPTVLAFTDPFSEVSIAMPYVLNTETAKLAAQKSVEARRRYAAERKQAAMMLKLQEANKVPEAPVEQLQSAYALELVRAQAELLAELRATPQAKDKAALSQALKNLKESWHMETGAPKPGTIKPERQSSRQQVKQPSEPKLDTTGGSSPA
jgi:hypothetical protein